MSDPKEQNRIDIEKRIRRDVAVLARFIRIFCDNKHSENSKSPVRAKGRTGEFLNDVSVELCDDCTKLLLHGAGKRITCPYDLKPRCKKMSHLLLQRRVPGKNKRGYAVLGGLSDQERKTRFGIQIFLLEGELRR